MSSNYPIDDDVGYPHHLDASFGYRLVRLIHEPRGDERGEVIIFRDFLGRITNGEAAHPVLFSAAAYTSEVFTLCASPFESSSTNTFNDAIAICQDFMESSSARTICVVFSTIQATNSRRLNADHTARLVVLSRYDGETASCLGIPQIVQDNIARQIQSSRVAKGANTFPSSIIPSITLLHKIQSSGTFCSAFVIVSICLFVLTVLVSSSRVLYMFPQKHSTSKYHTWRAYDTSGSIGPQYQLAIEQSNATSFKETYIRNSSEWFLRADDQALVPVEVISEEERKYQIWLKVHYPILDAVSRNKSYLDPEWLGSPAVNKVPVDDMFHFSHCVLALRRYIEAKQSGRHVCARDIDEKHMRHCLDALDWWAFPKTGRNGTIANPERPFWWRTKVCFF